jgi:hypothetical protein
MPNVLQVANEKLTAAKEKTQPDYMNLSSAKSETITNENKAEISSKELSMFMFYFTCSWFSNNREVTAKNSKTGKCFNPYKQ